MKQARTYWLSVVVGLILNWWVDVSADAQVRPDPAGWYTGDVHVHRSCGGPPVPLSQIYSAMQAADVNVVSVLADMGNGEVLNPATDLPKVTGSDDPISASGRIVHWDAEWHWDATFQQFPHQALGGHLVSLGLTEAHQIWEEYTYPVLQWARDQGAVSGFAHLQYLGDGIPQELDCCTPMEMPVEVALGMVDFISEDVNGDDSAMFNYYRLLNCGFRVGFAAGSDSPCAANVGSMVTYVQVPGTLTYRKWIDGLKAGRTVVSRNGRKEFLDFKVNSNFGPGGEIALAAPGSVSVSIQWTATEDLTGTIELVHNGEVIASQAASVDLNEPATLTTTVNVAKSGWLAARRMSSRGHELQSGAVFVIVGGAPIRASVDDAQFYLSWIDMMLSKTAPGGEWSSFFTTSGTAARARYQTARNVFQQIANEAAAALPLAISTESLPNGSLNTAYLANLQATGGIAPRTWSVISGSLPPGLTLTAGNGAIGGTPTSTGTFNFTVRVSDSSNPVKTASKALSVIVSAAVPSTNIWQASTVPTVVDGGADSPVELGVKFRSDVAGTITGIRFYKATANTGTHVGSLWSASGTRLAFANFSGESASGWQQVLFSSPVTIAANTVYIASYHCPTGHYSADAAYFTSVGIDRAPLHALANGVSGGNGVYRYGSAGTFPTQTWNAANYWVDVVFQPAATPSSITVTPTDPTVLAGATRQFAATANYSGGGTSDVTSQVAWTSSNTGIATINAAGLATGIAGGSSTITATLGSVSGSSTLAVQTAPLAITTTSLAGATLNTAYNATLTATGGTLPRSWTLRSGSLPPGLTLAGGTGVISGTPTSTGNFGFTVEVSDAGSPAQTSAIGLTIAVGTTPATLSLWTSANVPSVVDGGADNPVELGVKFRSDVAGTITGIRFYKASTNTGLHVGSLWSSTGTRLAFASFAAESASGWQQVLFSSPVTITPNTVYVASYHSTGGHYSANTNYFASAGFDRAPLHALANGVSGGNGVFSYGSAGTFPTQTWNAANYWVDVVFSPTPTSPLASIAVSPANPNIQSGASQQFTATGTYENGTTQNLTSQVTWTSSNTTAATINASGMATAVSVGSTSIAATLGNISGNTTLTVQAVPLSITTTSLASGTVNVGYTATLAATGGTAPRGWSVTAGSLPPGLVLTPGSGVISGTPTQAGTFNFTVQVSDAGTPTQSVTKALSSVVSTTPSIVTGWPGSSAPGLVDAGADRPVELGVKFRSDVAGTINGIRFYKAPGNTGAHVGSLWSSAGTRLAFATFNNETASGWQQVLFTTPVTIAANTTYVASYHSPVGHYSADINYFVNARDVVPLHFLASGSSGGNGVFKYGGAGTFPTNTWNAANYWVDVVFQPGTPVDTQAPTIVSISPASGVTGVSLSASVKITFSEAMSSASISSSTVVLRDSANTTIPATVSYNSADNSALVVPGASFNVAAAYSVTIKGGTSGVADVAGNRLVADVTSAFTTMTYGALAGGPGGPILIITDDENPFSSYYAEILLAEGLNAFSIKKMTEVSATTLSTVDVVILGSIPLTTSQVSILTTWVNAGGNLVAMRPDKKLAGLLGLTDAGTTLSEGYLLVNTSAGAGVGIVGETIQYHGTADRYTLSGATSIATLYSGASTSTVNPAVTVRNVGSNGGQAAAFTFDLARSIAQTRQGNPAWAGQERDGIAPLRSSDLFFGPAANDPKPNWVDFNKIAIPQADEQQRLLANLIIEANADKKLLPRFWYFPHAYEAAVVMTGDDHGNNGTQGRFDNQIALSPANGSVDDWETIRSTSYIYVDGEALTAQQAAAYTAQGFELALHVSTDCSNFTEAQFDTLVSQQLAAFKAAYPSLPSPRTNRTHCVAWSGYTITAEVQARYGIRLDTNYYYYPPTWIANRPGFMTGSGMPMRFATASGNTIDCYQAATQMTDESEQTYPFNIDELLQKAQGPEGYYGAFVANMHTDEPSTPDDTAITLAAVDRGVPIITALQLLTWTDARNSSSFGSIQSNGNSLSFSVNAGDRARGLKAMIPIPLGVNVAGVTFNGASLPYFLRVVKGIQYAFIDALDGNYQILFGQDNVAPTVVLAVPPSGQTNVVLNTDIQVVFSEPINVSTLTTSNVLLRTAAGASVPIAISYAENTGTAVITPSSNLAAGTDYTVTIKGGPAGVSDNAGNRLASDFQSSFRTIVFAGATFSLWNNDVTPATLADTDTIPIELGVKFRSSVPGMVRGIRFFKSPSNTGVHLGSLWNSSGSKLGGLTFSNESASGWQYQEFAQPIPITANTTYIVSYHTSVGRYSSSAGYFGTAFENGPLRGLANSEGGGNGVYRYGSSAFPNNTFGATNYWVDVVFEANP